MIDRGMMRWVPFSAIKEQFEGLNELYEKQNEVPMPILEEQKLEHINEIVCFVIAENKQVYSSYQIQRMFQSYNLFGDLFHDFTFVTIHVF